MGQIVTYFLLHELKCYKFISTETKLLYTEVQELNYYFSEQEKRTTLKFCKIRPVNNKEQSTAEVNFY